MADCAQYRRILEVYSDPAFKALLHIVNGSPFKNEDSYPIQSDKVDFLELSRLSGKHATDYYLHKYFQLYPKLLSQDWLQQHRDRMTRQAARSLRQLNELISVCNQLNNRNLPYAIIKGPHLARMLYGNSAIKVSVDLDILMVNPEDLFGFHAVFINAGYNCHEQKLLTGSWKQKLFISAKREVHYFNPIARCAVDLHVKPFANTILTHKRYRNFFSDLERVPFEGITVPVLPDEKYFVYLCHHGACHQFARLGWLLDIRNFYNQQKEILAMDKILSVAGFMNTKRSVTLAFYLLEALFDVPMPEKLKQSTIHPGIIEWLAEKCLKAISYKNGESLTLKARFERIVYLVKLTKGFAGKTDVVLSVFLRHLVLFLFGPKSRPIKVNPHRAE